MSPKPTKIQEIENALSPQEMAIVHYHRNTIASGTVGRDPDGNPVTVYSNTIQVPDGPMKGKFVTVPGYFDGEIHTDEGVLWKKWKGEIGSGTWPTYDDPREADERAKFIHGIMDIEEDGREYPELLFHGGY